MPSIAFSYYRFSSPEQAHGDSYRRQSALAEQYASQHNLVLDGQLSFRDAGVSAFQGRNARIGALRAFLDAVEQGFVPPESVLLIESLDRLSRQQILTAQALFLQIVRAGVTIVTLTDQRSYSAESLNKNPLDLIISLVIMMRANEESELKSTRLRAALAHKRSQLSQIPFTAKCPGWLTLNRETGKFLIVDNRADVIRRIFREILEFGDGTQTIARRLNREGVPLFGQGNQRGKMWTPQLIAHFLRTSTTIGTYIPCVTEYVDGRLKVRPLDPVPGYYPAIINMKDWLAAKAKREKWSRQHKCDKPKIGRANLLAHLSRCIHCDSRMNLQAAGHPNWRYLTCCKAQNGLGCADRWIRYAPIEDTLTIDIDRIIAKCPYPARDDKVKRLRLSYIVSRISELNLQKNAIQEKQKQFSPVGRPVHASAGLYDVENEIQKLTFERRSIVAVHSKWREPVVEARLKQLRNVATASNPDRMLLNELLRSLLHKVVIDAEKETLTLTWKHGGASEVWVKIKPLRSVPNPRRVGIPKPRASLH